MKLDIMKLQSGLQTKWLGRHIHYQETVASTNDMLKELAQMGEKAGTVVLTDFQHQGKGRLNRTWHAPAESSLLFSSLFRPPWLPTRAPWMTMIAGLAVIDAISTLTKLETSLKWPNDIIIQRRKTTRKLGGILSEIHMNTEILSWLIVGTGLNVNTKLEELPDTELPATSLYVETGKSVDREQLLQEILYRMEQLYEAANNGVSPQPAWNARLVTIGQAVKVSEAGNDAVVEGLAMGTSDLGHLIIRDKHGQIHRMLAGDVTLLG